MKSFLSSVSCQAKIVGDWGYVIDLSSVHAQGFVNDRSSVHVQGFVNDRSSVHDRECSHDMEAQVKIVVGLDRRNPTSALEGCCCCCCWGYFVCEGLQGEVEGQLVCPGGPRDFEFYWLYKNRKLFIYQKLRNMRIFNIHVQFIQRGSLLLKIYVHIKLR